MTPLIYIASFVALIVLVVGIHEAGHFAVAKASGIRVDEFAIGFGPRLWQRRRGETVYSIRALPLGGFVKMPGMSALEQDTGGERGFMAAKTSRKVAVLVAGVVMNFIFAGFMIGLASTQGHDSHVSGPLATAGLKDGDALTAVNGQPLDASNSTSQSDLLHAVTLQSAGKPIEVDYRSLDGATHRTQVAPQPVISQLDAGTPLQTADGKAFTGQAAVDSVDGHPGTPDQLAAALQAPGSHAVVAHDLNDTSRTVTGTVTGVVLDQGSQAIGHVTLAWRIGYAPAVVGQSLVPAILGGLKDVPGDIKDNVVSFWQIVTTPSSGGVKNFNGPVGIAHATSQAADSGIFTWFGLVGLVSLSLGIINVLPIPPFDGGRLVMVLGEAAVRRRLQPSLELGFIAAGVLAIVTLAIFITINDFKGF